ncbi:MAG: flagellar hook-basal body complex protein FliE [Rickettsiales bacterium]|nr:flagellar hook-basal body complex protein FliE [Rickettsiales bacterium]
MDVKFNQAANAYQNASQMKGFATPTLPGEEIEGPSFGELVHESLNNSRSKAYESEAISSKAIANKAELTDLVTSVTNAELTLQTVVAVRDRMITAYQDIIKMPI